MERRQGTAEWLSHPSESGYLPGLFDYVSLAQVPHHRIEYICSRDGVDFIDDSKATNPHAAIAALQAPSVLIVGGVDKGLHLGKL